jgi:predicted amidohydrolase YtcJ
MQKFRKFISWRNKRSSKQAVLNYMAVLNAVGLTTVYDVGRPSEGKLDPVAELAAAGALPLRVFHTLRYRAKDDQSTQDALKLIGQGTQQPLSMSNQFGLLGLGEHIYGPMHDRPRRTERWGEDVWGPVRSIATTAAKKGWPLHEHTMSRVTISQFLDLVREIAVHTPEVKKLRWTLAHALGISEDDIIRASDLGVAIAVHSQAMMNSRSRNRPPLGSLDRSNVLWGIGSDGAVVAPINPFLTLGWAVTGRNIAGQEAWSGDQRVSRKSALRAHTLSNAKMLFKEKEIGSLEVGKLADMVVLDRDYMTVERDQISQLRPFMTITNGRVVFEQK